MPTYKLSQKKHARYLYLYTALLQKDIAHAVNVSEKTMSRWVRNENWADCKRSLFYSPQQEVEQLFSESQAITDKINERPPGERFATKDELERRNKTLALIHAHLKNTGANWRNIAPEYDFENKNIVDLEALGALERKTLEKRQKAAEEDAKNGPGERFSPEELNEYYIRIANLKFNADSSASKVGKDGKPLAEDDPQRLKWEERMRQGKRPFVDDDEDENGKQSGSADKKSGRRSADGRSNDDLPEGETWMDMPEDDDE